MARTRSIKPAFFDNDILGDLQPLTRLLFIGLWCISDREGRLEDRPRKIKKALLGYDDVNADEVSGMLQQLHDSGFIIRYTANDDEYIQIVNFKKHQNPHVKEKSSEIPPPPGYEEETQQMHQTSTRQAPDNDTIDKDEEEPTEKPPLIQQRFDEFWKAYPKKIGKGGAEKAFKRLKPDAELFNKMIVAIEKAKRSEQWQKEAGKFIPYPTTWLNQGRWDDEMEVAISGINEQHPGSSNVSAAYTGGQSKSGALAGFKTE